MNMSFLTQNLVFYRCVLIALVCKKALKSGAHEFQDGLEDCSKIHEKIIPKWDGNASFSGMVFGILFQRLLGWILAPFWTPNLAPKSRDGPGVFRSRLALVFLSYF